MTRAGLSVDGHSLTLSALEAVAVEGAEVRLQLDPEARRRITDSYELNRRLVAEGRPLYGITTGVGKAVDRQIGSDRAAALQANLIRFLGCGTGERLPEEECRATVLARVNCLARGFSAVRPELIERLVQLLNLGVAPSIPALGSVGASGDLVPSSYVAAVVMGEREVFFSGSLHSAEAVHRQLGLEPLSLEPKEGLALVNGTCLMTGIGALATQRARRLAPVADACTALAVEVLRGVDAPFEPFLHEVKPHPGQVRSAAQIRRLLSGSGLAREYASAVESLGTLKDGSRRLPLNLQDHYSLRCAPQCIGALYDGVEWVAGILATELNSSNDNPLYDLDAGEVRSGGNFAGFHVGLAMDTLKVAVASVADLLDRQFALINDEQYNNGLGVCCRHPLPDDHPEAGIHHGFKGMQLVISALTAEALNACTPMTVFSRSTACHNQDKVSMAATAARQARRVVDLTERAAAVHLLLLAQAADLRGVEALAPATRSVYEHVRELSAYVERDRPLDEDVERVASAIRSGDLARRIEETTG